MQQFLNNPTTGQGTDQLANKKISFKTIVTNGVSIDNSTLTLNSQNISENTFAVKVTNNGLSGLAIITWNGLLSPEPEAEPEPEPETEPEAEPEQEPEPDPYYIDTLKLILSI